MLNRRLGKARSCKKKSCHYLLCSAIGLIILSIALIKKISSVIAKLKMLQALDYQIKKGIKFLVILK